MLSFVSTRACGRLLLLTLLLGWSGWLSTAALRRWRFERVCELVCPPLVPVELVDHFRHAVDWQTPLMLGTVPLLLLGICCVVLVPRTARVV